MPIVAAALGIVVVLAVLVTLKQFGVIGGGGPSTAETGPSPFPGTPGVPGEVGQGAEGPAPGEMSEAPGVPGGPAAAPGAPAVPSPAAGPGYPGGPVAAAPGAAEPTVKVPPMLPYRKDPFVAFTGAYGKPSRKELLMAVLPALFRPRLAPAGVAEISREEILEVLPPQPVRRMAGVLWNGKVSAILETAGEIDIVRPGQVVTRGNSKVQVESIEPDGIVLKTLDTREPMTIRVSLSGSAAAREAGGTTTTGMAPIYPSSPGGGPEGLRD